MRRREAVVAVLTAVASAGCLEATTEETQNMADELNLTDIKGTEVDDAYINDQAIVRAVDEEAGLVYVMSHVGSQGTSLEVLPLGQTTL